MKTTMIAALSLLAAALPASAAERRYSVSDFERIQIEGPFEVVLTTGKSPSALATGSHAAIDRVSISVEGRTLRVRPNRSAWSNVPEAGAGPVQIALSTHGLRSATLSGPGTLAIDKVRAMRFDMTVSGSGSIDLASVDADHLNLGVVGSGSISVGGKTKELRATVQGAAGLDGAALVAKDARIGVETSGNVEIGVSGTAQVTSRGTGDTNIIGSPACTVETMGSGRVTCGD